MSPRWGLLGVGAILRRDKSLRWFMPPLWGLHGGRYFLAAGCALAEIWRDCWRRWFLTGDAGAPGHTFACFHGGAVSRPHLWYAMPHWGRGRLARGQGESLACVCNAYPISSFRT
ncbi:MAG: hypothetical protein ACI30J_06140, partial [Paludibacteraceae bacterium]